MEDHQNDDDKELVKKMEEAYKQYQTNLRATDELIYNITKEARGNTPVTELLMLALDALDRIKGTDLRKRIGDILRNR